MNGAGKPFTRAQRADTLPRSRAARARATGRASVKSPQSECPGEMSVTARTARWQITGLTAVVVLAGIGCESVVRPEPRAPRLHRKAVNAPAVPASPLESTVRQPTGPAPDAVDLRELQAVPQVPAEQIVPELAPRPHGETKRP